MKKTLAAIVVASALTFGTIGIGHSNSLIEEYAECIEKYREFTPGKDYAMGNILVGFDEGTTEQEAKQFLDQEKYNELEMTNYFEMINYAVVKVPEGKEKGYVCFFDSTKDDTIVNSAELNHIMHILPAD